LFNGGGIKSMNGKNPFGGGQDVLSAPQLLAFAAAGSF
jgi:hypothetical protein